MTSKTSKELIQQPIHPNNADLGLSQPILFQKLKPLTVPILGILPIKNAAQSHQLNSILTSINAIIASQSAHQLLTPPMIHYIFFPLEQLYHQLNFQALSESCLNQLLALSVILVRASKSYPSNPLWNSKEFLILNAILPILTHKTRPVSSSAELIHQSSTEARSDDNPSTALDLISAILSPERSPAHSKPILDLDDLYQTPVCLSSLSPQLLRFLFEHLVDILDTLHQDFLVNPKRSQPSLERATKTGELIKLSLVRLSSSSIPGANGVDLLSTFLPSIISKLTQLVSLLAQRQQFSGLLSSLIHTLEWLLVECLDDELPDIQEILSVSEFQSIDHHQVRSEPCSQSQVFDQILGIAADWKLKQSTSTDPDSRPRSPKIVSPAFRQCTSSQEIVVKRDQSWLVLTSSKLSIVLQRLSLSLNSHPNPVVLEAWVHMCSQLLDRSSSVLRIGSLSSCAPTANQPNSPDSDGFRILVEALVTHRSKLDINQDRIISSLTSVTKSYPLASLQLIIDFIRVNFRSLSNLLVKQASGQDDQIINLTSRLISALNLIIQLVDHQIHPTHLYQSSFGSIDLSEFHQLLSLVMCRVQLVIPKVIEFQPENNSMPPSGAFSIADHTRKDQSDPDNLPNSFPNLSVKQIFDLRCIKALEELIQTISRLVLNLCYFNLGGSSVKISEIMYFDQLLQLSTSKSGATPPDPHHQSQQLNALWILGQSIRSSKSISGDDQHRDRFRRIEIFCLQGLKKLLEMVETYRVEGNSTQDDQNESSELMRMIDQDLDNLPVAQYFKGNDKLLQLEKIKPVSSTKGSKRFNKDEDFQNLRTCLILRLISSLAYVFEGSFQTNLSWILYYVLAQFGSPHPYVQQHAMATIGELSFYCGYGSIANMLEDNSDYLTQVISHQLLPYQYDLQAPFVLEHLIRLVGLPFILPLIEQVLLHDFFEILDDYHGYDVVCEELISVFGCVMNLMKNQIQEDDQSKHSQDFNHQDRPKNTSNQGVERIVQNEKHGIDEIFEVEQELTQVRWALAGPPSNLAHNMDLFKKFQAIRKRWIKVQNPSNIKEGDRKAENQSQNPRQPFGDIKDLGPLNPDETASSEPAYASPMTGYQKIATELINKSANFLSHSSPFVRLSVTRLMTLAVPILGSTASTPQESILLPCINKFWKIILNRLDVRYLESSQSESHPLLQIETLRLLGSLCVHVGSFMNKKLIEEIWPRIRRIIEEESARVSGYTFAGPGTRMVLMEAALETLLEILRSSSTPTDAHGRQHHISLKESLVWDVLMSLNRLRSSKLSSPTSNVHSLITRIFRQLVRLGFRGSVRVALKAGSGRIVGMEFLTPSPS